MTDMEYIASKLSTEDILCQLAEDVETLRGGGIDFKTTEVTHWMPLPEPPGGENNGD